MLLFRDDAGEEDRCMRILKKRHTNVEEVKIITLRNGTKIAKIKFKGNTLPDKICMGGRRRDIKPYIPKPVQCYNCSKFGHYKEYCKNTSPACFYCATKDHTSQWQCGGEEKCINCGGSHHSRSQTCPFYVYNAQVRHLQLRSGIGVRDAREELKERGILDPYKRTTYAKVAKADNTRQNEQKPTEEEEDMELTQQFTQTPTQASSQAESVTTEINRFAALGEENLDEGSQGAQDENQYTMQDLAGFWGTAPTPQKQRSKNKNRKQEEETQGKGAIAKRTRETSPTTESKTKEKEKKESPPTKRATAVDYSSTSEEETESEETPREKEPKGLPIPTIVSSNPCSKTPKERLPNPFRGEEIPTWGDHPLQTEAHLPDQTNDLEGVRAEISEMFGTSNKSQHAHTADCGCDSCFWKEKQELGQLTERKINEFINQFIKRRKVPVKTNDTGHKPVCMCVTCIKRKVEESREKVVKQIKETNVGYPNRDPRISKETKEPT